MPKLRVFSGAELCDFLGEHGFERVRQRGSHVIMRRGQVSFPVPLRSGPALSDVRDHERSGYAAGDILSNAAAAQTPASVSFELKLARCPHSLIASLVTKASPARAFHVAHPI